MEEVPAHVHPDPIVPDVLTRQHKHGFGLIWSGDYEMCITDLQCRRFYRNLFQAYSTAPCSFRGCMTDRGSPSPASYLGLVAHCCIAASATPTCSLAPFSAMWCALFNCSQLPTHFVWLPYHDRGLVLPDLWRAEVQLIFYEIAEYHHPGRVMRQLARDAYTGYIWYRDITQVYIWNPANGDTRTVRYQPAKVENWIMIACFAKKVQTIIRMCMPVSDRSARGVKRSARRLPSGGESGGRAPAPPIWVDEDMQTPDVEEREVRDLEDVDVEI
ncbi:hypothetical protein M9H77_29564 [Catharanthus roseus]|uniref:Uncharacterized protein n=1 Tax=Catharanthus roseus TaxID=4058 RepID=A0ACB9ZUS7_CATRO|nr:hypothetical protein M9H77_29564 [Catharanthus roseus]